MEHFQQLGIDREDLVGAEVAQDIVDPPQPLPGVFALLPLHGLERLAGMQVLEGERSGLWRNGRRGQNRLGGQEGGGTKAESEHMPARYAGSGFLQHGWVSPRLVVMILWCALPIAPRLRLIF
jgi:hypothetical protein